MKKLTTCILAAVLTFTPANCSSAAPKEQDIIEDCKDGKLDMPLEKAAILSSGKDCTKEFKELEEKVANEFKENSKKIDEFGEKEFKQLYNNLFTDGNYDTNLNQDLKSYMQADVLRYLLRKNLPRKYSTEANFTAMFTSSIGNCYTDTALFKSFADKLKLKTTIYAVKNHVVSGHRIGDKIIYLEHTNNSGKPDQDCIGDKDKMELKNKDLIARMYVGYSFNHLDMEGIYKAEQINSKVFKYLRKKHIEWLETLIENTGDKARN